MLARFTGTGRRFEVSEAGGVTIVDDYGHHPSELAATIAAIREAYPGRRLHVLFQPHLYSRTRHLARELGAALAAADDVAVTDVYPAREAPVAGVTGKLVVDALWTAAARGVDADGRAGRDATSRAAPSRATCCSRSARATSTARRRCCGNASASGTAGARAAASPPSRARRPVASTARAAIGSEPASSRSIASSTASSPIATVECGIGSSYLPP